jgi:RNA polymerase primary sigma factor
VVKIANSYSGFQESDRMDLISEGNLGLREAVSRFDPVRGKLSVYAADWIKQYIRTFMSEDGRAIRLPRNIVEKISKMSKVVAGLTEELGRRPSDGEVAEAMGVQHRTVIRWREASQKILSLDDLFLENVLEEMTIGETIMDETTPPPGHQHDAQVVEDVQKKMFGVLTPREYDVLKIRFGLEGGEPETLSEVGERYGVTRERIRQVQNKALFKLREYIQKRIEAGERTEV